MCLSCINARLSSLLSSTSLPTDLFPTICDYARFSDAEVTELFYKTVFRCYFKDKDKEAVEKEAAFWLADIEAVRLDRSNLTILYNHRIKEIEKLFADALSFSKQDSINLFVPQCLTYLPDNGPFPPFPYFLEYAKINAKKANKQVVLHQHSRKYINDEEFLKSGSEKDPIVLCYVYLEKKKMQIRFGTQDERRVVFEIDLK